MRPYLMIIWVGCLVIILSGGTLAAFDPSDGQGVTYIAIGLILLIVGLGIPWLSVWMQGWLLAPPMTVTVTPEKLISRSASVSSEYAGSTVRRVQEASGMWLVRLGHTHLLMLPKDGTDEAGRREFQRFLVERGLSR